MSTLAAVYANCVRSNAARVAFRYPLGATWADVTWHEFGENVRALHAALSALELLHPGERVLIVANTSPAWFQVAFASLSRGAAISTVQPEAPSEQWLEIAHELRPSLMFIESDAQMPALEANRASLASVRRVIVLAPTDLVATDREDRWSLPLALLHARGSDAVSRDPGALDRDVGLVTPDMVATIAFTSGTTGRPKGVALTHRSWCYVAEALASLGVLTKDDVLYLWMPMSYSFGLLMAAVQVTIGFASAIDVRLDRLSANLPVVRPTFLCGVPRLFEKLSAAIQGSFARQSPLVRPMIRAAGLLDSADTRAGGPSAGSGSRLRRWLLRPLVRVLGRRVRQGLGGRLRFFLCGGTALDPRVAEFYEVLGLPIFEGYGLTETCVVTSLNTPGARRPGTVGRPLPGTAVRLTDDGEILIKSPAVMHGYLSAGDAAALQVDGDGWLWTGDVGRLDGDGYLAVVDRKKDIIKTSTGKSIAPQPLEARLKALCPLIAEAAVVGEGRRYCAALVTLEPDSAQAWAARQGVAFGSWDDLAGSPALRTTINDAIARLNREQAGWSAIERFAILSRPFQIARQEVTSSLKIRRAVINRNYKDVIDGLY